MLLGQGKYRLEAEMKASGVAATVDEKGSGGGLRISGQNRNNEIAGDTDWTPVGFDFDVCEASQEVELVAELRATKGTLWIRAPLKLRKLE